MSAESARKKSDPEAPKAWINAIKGLYEGIHGNPEGLASWPKELIFDPPPKCPGVDTEEEKRKAYYDELWAWAYTPLTKLPKGYRLGYAIQVLSMIPDGPENATWGDVKAGISKDREMKSLLLHLDYILNIPDMEDDKDAKALCNKVYRRFFYDESKPEEGEKLKKKLDKRWGGVQVYTNFFAAKVARQRWKHNETPFSMGMKQAAEDLATGLESPMWKKLEQEKDMGQWTLRYTGSARFYTDPVPKDL